MSADSKPTSRWPLTEAALSTLGVIMTTVLGWLAGSSQTLPVPAKPATALLGALIGLALLWAKWTHALWKLSSKRERIRDALSMGRPICHCSESSEIMTQHHALEHSIDVYACPVCKNFEIVHPKGSVLIAENTEFRPPLPATVRQHWLNQSNQLR